MYIDIYYFMYPSPIFFSFSILSLFSRHGWCSCEYLICFSWNNSFLKVAVARVIANRLYNELDKREYHTELDLDHANPKTSVWVCPVQVLRYTKSNRTYIKKNFQNIDWDNFFTHTDFIMRWREGERKMKKRYMRVSSDHLVSNRRI